MENTNLKYLHRFTETLTMEQRDQGQFDHACNAGRMAICSGTWAPKFSKKGTGAMKKTKSISPARHESHCQICNHARRAEIEECFLFWESPTQIAKQFNLSRAALYRHVRARNLLKSRDANIRVALSSFIERGMRVRVTAQSFVAACIALSKLDAEGRSIERIQAVGDSGELFQKMSRGEMLSYAETGALPAWWKKSLPDTPEREAEPLDA
jgi:hypothetical protein